MDVDVRIPDVDDEAFRRLQAWAAHHRQSVGEALSGILRTRFASPAGGPKTGSFADLPHEDFGPGTEHLSDEIDEIVYGVSLRESK